MKVSDFLESIKEIKYKNFGGCLFFCYVFYLWLKKNNLPTDTFFIRQYADQFYEDSLQANMSYKAAGYQAYASNHFTWFYDGKEYDGEGGVTNQNFCSRYQHSDLKQICEYNLVEAFCKDALTFGGWNSTFKRRDAIKVLEEKFDMKITI